MPVSVAVVAARSRTLVLVVAALVASQEFFVGSALRLGDEAAGGDLENKKSLANASFNASLSHSPTGSQQQNHTHDREVTWPFFADTVTNEDDNREPYAIIVCTCFFFGLVGLVWCCGIGSAERQEEALDTEQVRRKGKDLRWLLLLSLTALGLLVLQVALGVMAQSLTLLADSAHSAADVFGYFFAFFAERALLDLNASGVSTAARFVDVASALLTLFVVLVPSTVAMYEAAVVLGWTKSGAPSLKESHGHDHQSMGTDFKIMGLALLCFSLAACMSNLALMLMYLWRDSGTEEELESVEGEEADVTKQQQASGERPLSQSALAAVPLVATLPLAAGMPRDTSADSGAVEAVWRRPKPKKKKKPDTVKLLHMAFHPGCECEDDTQGDNAQHPSEAEADRKRSVSDPMRRSSRSIHCGNKEEHSLNMLGALLHLWMDIARSIVILCAGLLIVARLVHDPFQADAVCAIVVGICVLVGSLSLLRSICQRLVGSNRQVDETTSAVGLPPSVEAASDKALVSHASPIMEPPPPPAPVPFEGVVRRKDRDRGRPVKTPPIQRLSFSVPSPDEDVSKPVAGLPS
eukprot:TRINITY_DN19026_c0_g2_i3.p1 TRINITY_DN19026_c0_g2~~TRINITY_DN19026_c0_g2_i3.p1  ORF type:complete len:579 (-),score=139.11 TRINITY_DN19026_c0_g2_i3:186-1922(-)